MDFDWHRQNISSKGFTVLEHILDEDGIKEIIDLINQSDAQTDPFRKSEDLFAIRQFFKTLPGIAPLVLISKLNALINGIFGQGYFVTKSIYFDKPARSNWFVAYHQDLTISVNQKAEVSGYTHWTTKQNQYAVQPPAKILEQSFTVRIHLDDTNKDNGALKVIPGSHLNGVRRPDDIDFTDEKEIVCDVGRGGVMIMRPLLMHASDRTVNNRQRRVIHIEFSKAALPQPLQWAERYNS
ncbi:phytanoyl-CoA dioxygenase family protein [Mucilaginibacter sp. CSA2-8R]|uniref:phytanoyl-CoA dioxygenase family protein n=1 Tax=Mucilaginibacter sp. CSA2-8R TaxID=3141542 RepID=UPI00315DE4FC